MSNKNIMVDIKTAKEKHKRILDAINSDKLQGENIVSQIKISENNLKKIQEELDLVNQEIVVKTNTVKLLLEKIEKLKKEVEVENNELSEVLSMIEEREKTAELLKNKITILQSEYDSKKLQLEKKHEEIKVKLEGEIKIAEKDEEILLNNNKVISEGNKNLLKKQEELESKNADIKGELNENIKFNKEASDQLDGYEGLVSEKLKLIDDSKQELLKIKEEKDSEKKETERIKEEKEQEQKELDNLKGTRIAIAKAGEQVEQAYEHLKVWYDEAGMSLPKVKIDWSGL